MGAIVIVLMVMMEVVMERASWVLEPHMDWGRVRATLQPSRQSTCSCQPFWGLLRGL